MRRQLLVNGTLLALALVTFGAVWATRQAPTSAELAERKDKLLPALRQEDVTRVRLARDASVLELARAGDEFRIERPWAERADIASVRQLLGALELASTLRPVDGVSAAQAGLGVGALLIQVDAGKFSGKVRLGGNAPSPSGARYAQVEVGGKTQLYVVSPGVASELDLPFEKFREARLLEYGRSELSRITLTSELGKLELEQREHAAFFLRVGERWELANREATDAVLTALSRLASEQLLDAEQARAALVKDAPRVQLELNDKKLAPVTLSFGGACPTAPDQAFVLREQAGRSARAGCIPSDVAAALRIEPKDARLFGAFAARTDEVEELRVVRGEEKLDLARKDKAFVLRGKTTGDVPLAAGNARIAAILAARGVPGDEAFQPAGEVTLQLAGGDEASHREERVSFGQPRADGKLCLKRALDGVTLCVDAESARAFEPDASLLRSLAVLSFAASDVTRIALDARGEKQLVLRRDDGSYELQEPKGFMHDGALVANLVQTLGSLPALRWVAATDEARFGLAAPRLRIAITLKANPAPRELVVGAVAAGGYFARLEPDPGVFVLPGSAFADLSSPLIDRSLSPFSEAELERVELRAGSGKAVTVSGPLLATLAALRAEQALHVGAPKPAERLDRPQLTVSFTSKAGKKARLDVGACDTLDDVAVCYARRDDVDATFVLSRRLVAELQDFSQDAH
jgi:hypothetical protein